MIKDIMRLIKQDRWLFTLPTCLFIYLFIHWFSETEFLCQQWVLAVLDSVGRAGSWTHRGPSSSFHLLSTKGSCAPPHQAGDAFESKTSVSKQKPVFSRHVCLDRIDCAFFVIPAPPHVGDSSCIRWGQVSTFHMH